METGRGYLQRVCVALKSADSIEIPADDLESILFRFQIFRDDAAFCHEEKYHGFFRSDEGLEVSLTF